MQGGREFMKNEINADLENMTTTAPEPEDYTGEDGVLYCGKCRKPKEAYFAPDKAAIFGRDRHPAECDCQRAAREEREAAEKRRRYLDAVEERKRRGFTDPTTRDWTFENDNGRNPQAGIARRYVEHWEDMRADNIGCLFWGGVGTGKSYLAGCIANALMEKEIPVHMTNFALISIIYTLLWRGHGGEWLVSIFQSLFKMDYENALNLYQQLIRNNMGIVWGGSILLVFLILYYAMLTWFIRYFNQINQGIDALLKNEAGEITLPAEMSAVEKKLNTVRQTLD